MDAQKMGSNFHGYRTIRALIAAAMWISAGGVTAKTATVLADGAPAISRWENAENAGKTRKTRGKRGTDETFPNLLRELW